MLNATAFWPETVAFLAGHMGSELEHLNSLLVESRLTAYVEQLVSEVLENDSDDEGQP